MNNGIPNTPEKVDRCFIVKAAANSAMALQMAQQIWTDPEQAGYELADLVEIINTVSLKLKKYCEMVNFVAHSDKPKERRFMTKPQNCGSGFCSCIECPYEPRLVGWLTPDNVFTRHEPDDLTGCKEVRVPSIDYSSVANDMQVGGTHYRNKIQPWDYIISHNLNYLEGNIIKYVTRYKGKHGVEDLQKARHYLDKLIETYTEEESWTKQTR